MVRAMNLFSFPLRTLSGVVVSLPLFGLTFGIFWSLLLDFKRSTSTHCQVGNFLPSVSASISLTPQAYVWRTCIAIHTTPRYLLCYALWIWNSEQTIDTSKQISYSRILPTVIALGNFFELSALLGLTLISSTENFVAHKTCFILFIIGSLVCMFLTVLHSSTTIKDDSRRSTDRHEKRRKIAVIVYVIGLVLCVYFYYRHNTYCEPGVYSLFALCEYIIIVSNMGFHYFCAMEFEDCSLTIVDNGFEKSMV